MPMGLDLDIDHEQQRALVDPDHKSPNVVLGNQTLDLEGLAWLADG